MVPIVMRTLCVSVVSIALLTSNTFVVTYVWKHIIFTPHFALVNTNTARIGLLTIYIYIYISYSTMDPVVPNLLLLSTVYIYIYYDVHRKNHEMCRCRLTAIQRYAVCCRFRFVISLMTMIVSHRLMPFTNWILRQPKPLHLWHIESIRGGEYSKNFLLP